MAQQGNVRKCHVLTVCCMNLLKFSLVNEKSFGGTCITAVSPAALHVVSALWLVQNPQEQKSSDSVTLEK